MEAVGGRRLRWAELPAHIRAAIEGHCGAAVLTAHSRQTGFSPGLASVLELADGRRIFVKAVNAERNADSPGMHRREAEILAALPPTLPVPRLLWCHDDGDWVALGIEAVDGHTPVPPFRQADLDAYLRLGTELAGHPFQARSIVDVLGPNFDGWRRLAGGTKPATVDRLPAWARRDLDRLAAVEEDWSAAAAGDTLVHADLRLDNVVVRAGGDAVAVDWPAACTGAPWLDVLLALPSIAMHGPDPAALWAAYPPARRADPDAVVAVLAALSGFFLSRCDDPPPRNIPTVREFQRAQGTAGLAWLRTMWATP